METDEIRVKGEMELRRGVDYLQGIIDSLRKGAVCVEHAEESVRLTPPERVWVAVKARRKRDKETISVKISWRAAPEPSDADTDLKISSEMPPRAEAPVAPTT